MANHIEHAAQQVEEANKLYWTSSESVNRIANRLGLSKGSLYAAIRPKPSDSMCPTCGSQLGFANRTALEKGTLSCSECAHEFTVRPERVPVPTTSTTTTPTSVDPAPPETAQMRRPGGSPVRRSTTHGSRQLVVGTTLLALGTGLLLSRLVRRS